MAAVQLDVDFPIAIVSLGRPRDRAISLALHGGPSYNPQPTHPFRHHSASLEGLQAEQTRCSSPRSESAGRRSRRTHIHEPKDLDLAVWIDEATDLERLRVLRSHAVNQLWQEREIGVAHHQVDVFLLDATTDKYLGRLCCFNQCPKDKPECNAVNCGRVPFLRQHDGFVLDDESLRPQRVQVLYEREREAPLPLLPKSPQGTDDDFFVIKRHTEVT